ncbi:kinesin light chain, partial [Diplogelasinospora grovesii]
MRNWLEEKGELEEIITGVIRRLAVALPFPGYKNREVWMKYLPHTQVISECRIYCTDKKAETRLLYNVATSYSRLGKYKEAERLHRQALELFEKVLGRENPFTVTNMNNLALTLKSQGKYEEAERLHRQALELFEKVLGRENPFTVNSMNNLALTLKSQGKYEEAEPLHRQ